MTPPVGPALTQFAHNLEFPLDPFQVQACQGLEQGRGVLVAAPTGAGKTIVGEFAVHLALTTGTKAFYTTPIKALSNQKYHDLVERHGSERVGLLTGDQSINGEAPVVVMTTEVLRNMLYAGSSTLAGLGFVVMDEVHYLADRFRGAVWEEVIIHLPASVQVVSLSATVSNAEEFGAWLAQVRGDTEVIVSERRPVPLWQHVLIGTMRYDLFADGHTPNHPDGARINPELARAVRDAEYRGRQTSPNGIGRFGEVRSSRKDRGSGGHRGTGRGTRGETPRRGGDHVRSQRRIAATPRADVVRQLDQDGLLPAIDFIFSRAGCDAAVGQLLRHGVRLISERAGVTIQEHVEQRIESLAERDLSVLGYWDFVDGLTRGYAAHHAGMLPLFREIVEELFTAGRIRLVFATETLALGINMPARTVLLEKLVKFNGETHADITPAEYTQLTGRAGRRGIDFEGHAVVQWTSGMDPAAVAGLASTRTFPLRSSFRPTYNMAVNLVAQVGRDVARDILETSFAQFQADRSVVGIASTSRRNDEALAAYAEAMTCQRGDFAEYAGIRREITRLEKSGSKKRAAAGRAQAAESLARLGIGDVIYVPAGRRAGWAVVVRPDTGRPGQPPSPSVVTEDKQLWRLTSIDVPRPIDPVLRMTVPKNVNFRSAKVRRDLATTLRIKAPADPPPRRPQIAADEEDLGRIGGLRKQLTTHPCHGCPDREQHARWSSRWWKLSQENAELHRRMRSRTHSVARTFDRICGLLDRLGYLADAGTTVTAQGRLLRRLYTEKDLVAAECLKAGVWQGLDAPSLAAVVSSLVHESRTGQIEFSPRMPNPQVGEAIEAMATFWSALEEMEREASLPLTGSPDGGMAHMVHGWATGKPLDEVLRGTDVSAGDFVRRCKQVVDLLDQIAEAASQAPLRRTARDAVDAVLRGVVAADRVD
ncbi:MAG: DEAD/DEAH box helicase [Nostocoides sp.]